MVIFHTARWQYSVEWRTFQIHVSVFWEEEVWLSSLAWLQTYLPLPQPVQGWGYRHGPWCPRQHRQLFALIATTPDSQIYTRDISYLLAFSSSHIGPPPPYLHSGPLSPLWGEGADRQVLLLRFPTDPTGLIKASLAPSHQAFTDN